MLGRIGELRADAVEPIRIEIDIDGGGVGRGGGDGKGARVAKEIQDGGGRGTVLGEPGALGTLVEKETGGPILFFVLG